MTYAKGLVEVADDVFAYLQPDGGWGWSNAGLVRGQGSSLLVDTLFDLALTWEMLESMAPVTLTDPIGTLVNTHANGDHCYGNQLVQGAEVVASAASAAEMDELPPARLAALMRADLPPRTARYLEQAFGAFTFDGIDAPHPTRTFEGALTLEADGIRADLVEVGPAHTKGDVLVHLPEAEVVFAGDILFIGGTPILWDGPVDNWVAACDRILEWAPTVIVPGHGPLTDADGVRDVRDYLRWIEAETTARFEAGLTAAEATHDLDPGGYRDWLDWERLAINVETIYRHLDPDHRPADVVELFGRMAALVDA